MSDAPPGSVSAALRSGDPARQRAALERLAAARQPLDEAEALAVVATLGAAEKAVQRRAADVLRLTDAAARPAILAQLRVCLRAAELPMRWGAAFALGQLGMLDAELVPALLEALAVRDGDQRWAAAALLVACGRLESAAVVPALLAALDSEGKELRKMALYVLRDLAPGTPEVTRALVGALADPEVGVRLAALSALCRLDPLPEDACALVVKIAREDANPGLRRAAVSALGHVGQGAGEAREILDAAAASDDPGLRRAAAAALRLLASR
jgi:HEAT repeat protein